MPAGLAKGWATGLGLVALPLPLVAAALVALVVADYRGGCQRGVVQVERRKVRGITGIFGLTSANREKGFSGV